MNDTGLVSVAQFKQQNIGEQVQNPIEKIDALFGDIQRKERAEIVRKLNAPQTGKIPGFSQEVAGAPKPIPPVNRVNEAVQNQQPLLLTQNETVMVGNNKNVVDNSIMAAKNLSDNIIVGRNGEAYKIIARDAEGNPTLLLESNGNSINLAAQAQTIPEPSAPVAKPSAPVETATSQPVADAPETLTKEPTTQRKIVKQGQLNYERGRGFTPQELMAFRMASAKGDLTNIKVLDDALWNDKGLKVGRLIRNHEGNIHFARINDEMFDLSSNDEIKAVIEKHTPHHESTFKEKRTAKNIFRRKQEFNITYNKNNEIIKIEELNAPNGKIYLYPNSFTSFSEKVQELKKLGLENEKARFVEFDRNTPKIRKTTLTVGKESKNGTEIIYPDGASEIYVYNDPEHKVKEFYQAFDSNGKGLINVFYREDGKTPFEIQDLKNNIVENNIIKMTTTCYSSYPFKYNNQITTIFYNDSGDSIDTIKHYGQLTADIYKNNKRVSTRKYNNPIDLLSLKNPVNIIDRSNEITSRTKKLTQEQINALTGKNKTAKAASQAITNTDQVIETLANPARVNIQYKQPPKNAQEIAEKTRRGTLSRLADVTQQIADKKAANEAAGLRFYYKQPTASKIKKWNHGQYTVEQLKLERAEVPAKQIVENYELSGQDAIGKVQKQIKKVREQIQEENLPQELDKLLEQNTIDKAQKQAQEIPAETPAPVAKPSAPAEAVATQTVTATPAPSAVTPSPAAKHKRSLVDKALGLVGLDKQSRDLRATQKAAAEAIDNASQQVQNLSNKMALAPKISQGEIDELVQQNAIDRALQQAQGMSNGMAKAPKITQGEVDELVQQRAQMVRQLNAPQTGISGLTQGTVILTPKQREIQEILMEGDRQIQGLLQGINPVEIKHIPTQPAVKVPVTKGLDNNDTLQSLIRKDLNNPNNPYYYDVIPQSDNLSGINRKHHKSYYDYS